MAEINIYNCDCMEFMKSLPDKAYELAIVDPPTGQKYARGKNGWGVCDNRPDIKDVNWDVRPDKKYFDELLRVSKNQVVWCAVYFTDMLPQSKCWHVWDKTDTTDNKSVFADCELAWTSFNKVIKKTVLRQMGFISDTRDVTRIHPTQKPTELYQEILKNYAKQGDKILDTHGGSGSIAIACDIMGFDLDVCELDTDYYNAAVERFERHKRQGVLQFD
jgi:site-specific DNA-methyltransferase (adenine-specific)